MVNLFDFVAVFVAVFGEVAGLIGGAAIGWREERGSAFGIPAGAFVGWLQVITGGTSSTPFGSRHELSNREVGMAVATPAAHEARGTSIRHGLPKSFKREGTVYAIAFDMDIELLRLHYGDPYNNAYIEIRRVLERHQFTWQQGSMYFGDASVTAASAMLATIDLATQLPWFAASVRDVRMLRIEELNDLMPVAQRVAGMSGGDI